MFFITPFKANTNKLDGLPTREHTTCAKHDVLKHSAQIYAANRHRMILGH
jgi:hypothetical protein